MTIFEKFQKIVKRQGNFVEYIFQYYTENWKNCRLNLKKNEEQILGRLQKMLRKF